MNGNQILPESSPTDLAASLVESFGLGRQLSGTTLRGTARIEGTGMGAGPGRAQPIGQLRDEGKGGAAVSRCTHQLTLVSHSRAGSRSTCPSPRARVSPHGSNVFRLPSPCR